MGVSTQRTWESIPVSDPENISTMKFLLAVVTLFAALTCVLAYPQPEGGAVAEPEADAWHAYYGYPSTYGYNGYYGYPYGYYGRFSGYGRGKRSAQYWQPRGCFGCGFSGGRGRQWG